MTLHLVSIAVLVVAFVVATVTPLNLGALTLVGTFAIGGVVVGLSPDDLYAGFPASLVVMLVGVTYLFNVASANGTVDKLVSAAVRMVRGRTTLIPWIMFGAAAVCSGIGAAFAVPIVAPIALAFAARQRISQLYMGIMVIHGCMAGSLSPISLYGVIVNGVLAGEGFRPEPLGLFVSGFVANAVAALAVTVVLRKSIRIESTVGTPVRVGGGGVATGEESKEPGPTNWEQRLTLAAITLLVVLGVVAQADVGLLAITLAVVLGLTNPKHHKYAVASIPWPVVLLVCGVLTYVGVLQHIGTVDFLGTAVTAIGAPLTAALVLGYIGAVVSAFATSSGVIAALVPLAIPLLQSSDLSPLAVVILLAVASTIVDVSPFSTNGAVVVANATDDQRERVLRGLLRYGGIVVAAAPFLLWLTIVVPS
ncbi:SLC13 family permease [Prauserella flavalba]|uniref:Dicarboxylate carrier MatC N-terminal domain-containing protein n=1 Tax=Prauserella flavalba TaxID=1477506 RepID=A0A318LBR8_9PSEU|nr:SLC13 family permease [Prauserella flavalba]PXY21494.1 hypothetical protein BA062_31785 [Prauserella flavalba]